MIDNTVLLERIKAGERSAEDQLVENNMGLVIGLAKRFYNRGYDMDELIQIGSIGLIKAIRKFSDEYGVKFSTYAVPMILGELKRFLRDDGIIKVSRTYKTNAQKIRHAQEILSQKLNREPTIAEISAQSGLSSDEIIAALDATAVPESIYQQNTSSNNDDRELMDKITAVYEEDKIINKVIVNKSLDILNDRERKIIVMRYFMGKTQSKIAKIIGVSQVQISRIEKSALIKMRSYLEQTEQRN